MGGSSKLDKLKALQKEGKKGIVIDKTFGLKNKNKSKKVQSYVRQVECSKRAENEQRDKLKTEKRNAKIARIEAEMELKALFSEGLSITVKRKDLHRKKKQDGGGGGSGVGEHYDEAWAESELKKADTGRSGELTLEQRIEKKRQEFRDKGIKGVPVTPDTVRKWKEIKVAKLLKEKLAAQKVEQLKKKGCKSMLSGKDLYVLQKDLFVDDAEADDARGYVREERTVDENYDEDGASLKSTVQDLDEEVEMEKLVSISSVQVRLSGNTASVNASLYLNDNNSDNLEDLDCG
jgi:hypothetical protein